MDLTKSPFYQSLTDCEDDGTVDATFREAVERDLDPLAVKIVSSIGDSSDMAKLFINSIRSCDYLGTDVPRVFTDGLYDVLQRLNADQLKSVIEEFGENEIGLAVGRVKKLKPVRDNKVFYNLQLRHARSVEIDVWTRDIYEKAEEIFTRTSTSLFSSDPIFTHGWNNLRKIINFSTGVLVTLRSVFPNLEQVGSCSLKIEAVQPSLTAIRTNTYGLKGSIQIPNLRLLMPYCDSGYGDITVVHPHLEVSHLYHPKFTPNVKALFKTRVARAPINLVTSDVCIYNQYTTTESWTKFFNCVVNLFQHDDRPLEFYSCTFQHQCKDITVDEAKKLLPNATFVMCGIHWG